MGSVEVLLALSSKAQRIQLFDSITLRVFTNDCFLIRWQRREMIFRIRAFTNWRWHSIPLCVRRRWCEVQMMCFETSRYLTSLAFYFFFVYFFFSFFDVLLCCYSVCNDDRWWMLLFFVMQKQREGFSKNWRRWSWCVSVKMMMK